MTATFKPLKLCTFEDRFRLRDDFVVRRLVLTTAKESVKHLGCVCITDDKTRQWVSWNTCVEIVA